MIIAKELEWVRDYITAASHLLPHIKQLKKISVRKANKKNIQRVHGICNKYFDKVHYKITLYTTYSSVDNYKPLVIKLHHYSQIDILRHLAHELAHMEHWEHTPDRMFLECSVMAIFMTKLKAEGYKSEEEEAKLVKGILVD